MTCWGIHRFALISSYTISVQNPPSSVIIIQHIHHSSIPIVFISAPTTPSTRPSMHPLIPIYLPSNSHRSSPSSLPRHLHIPRLLKLLIEVPPQSLNDLIRLPQIHQIIRVLPAFLGLHLLSQS